MTATTATATINLTGRSAGFLNSVLADLQVEAAKALTVEAYASTKAQVDRVRAALAAQGAL